MAKKILTLDIGAANIALAEYELGAKGDLTLLNYGTAALAAPIDTGDAATILSPALLELVREKGFKPGDVAVSVSGQMVFPRIAAIPAVGGDDKFEQNIRYEIEQNVPFPIDEMVCDSQVLGDTPSGDKSVMIVAAKVGQIEAVTDAVASAGFRPVLVDVAPIATLSALKAANSGDESSVIVLDIGAKTTSLMIVEGDKVYNRSIPIAGNNITREIAQAFGISQEEAERLKIEKGYVALGGVVEDDDAEADRVSKICRAAMSRLLAEISRSVNFYRSQQGGGAPVRLYLTGGTALLPQTDRFFAESLQIEVEYFNPFDFVAVGASVDADALAADGALISPTIGLALHAANASAFTINLLPPSLVEARAEKAKVPVVAAAAGILLAALAVAFVAMMHADDVSAAVKDSLEDKVSALKGYEDGLKKANAAVDAAREKADTVRALVASRSMPVVRMNAVRAALANGMWIEKWEDNRVTIRGWKDDIDGVVEKDATANGGKHRTASEIVVARLKGSAAIDPEGVKISDMTAIGKNGDIEQFTVELKFK